MNDTFAATVAAVVPVVWLVASIEMQRYHRRLRVEVVDDQMLSEAVKAVRSVPLGSESAEAVAQARSALAAETPKEGGGREHIHDAYQLISLVLLAAEAFSLLWLLGDHSDPVSNGWFLFVITMLGFIGVFLLPLVANKQEARELQAKRDHQWRELRAFLERLDRD